MREISQIIFDMDGVITSEQLYWDTAALTVYSNLFPSENAAETLTPQNIATIRKRVFDDEKTITLCKNSGVNSNWDLTYVVCAFARIFSTQDFSLIREKIQKKVIHENKNALDLYEFIDQKSGGNIKRMENLWQELQNNFQIFYKQLIQFEQPLFPLEKLHATLSSLCEKGMKLGIATGRISEELIPPLTSWDILKYFDENMIMTYSDVQCAETLFPETPLGKPHKYMFLKAALGKNVSDKDVLSGNYDTNILQTTLAVGDSAADLFSAKSAGLKFAAVLSGASGRDFFTKNNADYILNDIFQLEKQFKC